MYQSISIDDHSPSAPSPSPSPSRIQPSRPSRVVQPFECTFKRVWYSISFFALIVTFWMAAQMLQEESQAQSSEQQLYIRHERLPYIFGVLYFSAAGFGVGILSFEVYPRIVSFFRGFNC